MKLTLSVYQGLLAQILLKKEKKKEEDKLTFIRVF